MHKGLFVVFFIFTSLTFAQVDEPMLDSLSRSNPVFKQLKDSLVGVSSELESSKDSITQELKTQTQKSKKIQESRQEKTVSDFLPFLTLLLTGKSDCSPHKNFEIPQNYFFHHVTSDQKYSLIEYF